MGLSVVVELGPNLKASGGQMENSKAALPSALRSTTHPAVTQHLANLKYKAAINLSLYKPLKQLYLAIDFNLAKMLHQRRSQVKALSQSRHVDYLKL